MDFIKKLQLYLDGLRGEDRIAVIYHNPCGDGICSGVLVTKALERILKKKITYFYPSPVDAEGVFEYIQKNNIKKAVIVDLAVASKEIILKMEAYADLLIIDHHEFKDDVNSKKTTFLHADFLAFGIKSSNYPGSKLIYDLFSQLTDLSDLDWLACAGLVSDSSYIQWKDFVLTTMSKYHMEIKEDIFSTDLGKVINYLSFGLRVKEVSDQVFDLVYDTQDYLSLLQNPLLTEASKKVGEEVKYFIDHRDKAEVHGNLIIYEIKSTYPISSPLSTVLSFNYFLHKTVVLLCDTGEFEEDFIKLSARDQSGNVRVNDLLQKALEGIPHSSAGGHAPAAGGKLDKNYVAQFKKQLLEAYIKL